MSPVGGRLALFLLFTERRYSVKGRHESFLIDFQQVKDKKQNHIERSLTELYELFFSYMEHEANIREKVRAKQLFAHKTKVPGELVLEQPNTLHFEHWFAFDYVTVIGSRMFDLFIREKKGELTKTMLDLSGFMMLMSLEPVRVKEVYDNSVIIESLYTGEIREANFFIIIPELKKGEFSFVRTLRAGFKEMVFGPAFSIDAKNEGKVISELEKVYTSEDVTIKKYLKESGIDYFRYKKG